jgi:hypothetical protein
VTGATNGPTFGLWYAFRNPGSDRPFSRLHQEVLEQVAGAEQRGLGSVWLIEHHFCDDGYGPSPFVLASARVVGDLPRTSVGKTDERRIRDGLRVTRR